MRLYVYLVALMMGMSAWATEKAMSLETTTETKHSGVSTQREIEVQFVQVESDLDDYSNEGLQELFVSSKKAAE